MEDAMGDNNTQNQGQQGMQQQPNSGERQNPGQQQSADRLFGQNRIDDEGRARRDP